MDEIMTNQWILSLLDDLSGRCGRDQFALQGIERLKSAVGLIDSYVFRSETTEKLSEAVMSASSNDELSEYLNLLAYEAGFDYASVLLVQYGRRTLRGARAVVTFPDHWVETYLNEGFFFVDPLVTKARESCGLVELRESDLLAMPDQRFAEASAASGIGSDAIGLSVHLPDGTKGLVSFCNAHPDAAARQRREHKLPDVMQVSRELFYSFLDINTVDCHQDDLTEAEKQFLNTLICSERPEDAFQVLPAFGSNASLQKGLMEKLGVVSLFQAAAVAAKLNLGEVLPPKRNEIVQPRRGFAGKEFLTR